MPDPPRRTISALFFAARAAYAFSWYDIGAVLPLIGDRFHAGAAELGLVLGAFLAAVGLFQIPAGFLALRWGNRATALFGLLLLGGASVLSAVSPDLIVLAATRFAAGVGAAFFFAPGLSLISSYYASGERGPVIGAYNAAFNVGGGIGLVGGVAAGYWLGWAPVLAIGGAAVLGSAFAVWRIVPAGREAPPPRGATELWRVASAVLRSRRIWLLATSLIGFWAVVNVLSLYFVQFAHDARPGWGPGAAAALAAGVVLISAPGGPIGGWLSERGIDRRTLAVGFAAVTGLLLLGVPFLSFAALVPTLLLLGVVSGIVFAVQYTMPTDYPESSGERAALAIGLVNSVQVLVGSGITALFGFVAESAGYTSAWILTAAIGLALLPLLAFVPSRAPEAGTPGSPPP